MNERRHGYGLLGHRDNRQDYIPAAGDHALLTAYDLLSRAVGSARLHRRLVELADLRAEERVLEIACGTGNLTVLTKRCQPDADVVGLDPDPGALARATRKATGLGIRFDRGYSQALPYPDGSFDRVLSALMLHHLEGDVRVRTARAARCTWWTSAAGSARPTASRPGGSCAPNGCGPTSATPSPSYCSAPGSPS